MRKRYIIGLIFIILVIILGLIIKNNYKQKKDYEFNSSQKELWKEYEWIEDENRYVVYGDNGEIRGYADDEYGLKIFKDNPDFNMESVPDGYYDRKEIIESNEQ